MRALQSHGSLPRNVEYSVGLLYKKIGVDPIFIEGNIAIL